jgi:hypothetical protein
LLHQPLYVPTQPPFPHQPPYSSAVDSSWHWKSLCCCFLSTKATAIWNLLLLI